MEIHATSLLHEARCVSWFYFALFIIITHALHATTASHNSMTHTTQAIERRRETLLVEYKEQGKSNTFVDR